MVHAVLRTRPGPNKAEADDRRAVAEGVADDQGVGDIRGALQLDHESHR
jgi:hypothetical protein